MLREREGACVGCTWTDLEASGLQSIVWRAKWEATRDDVWKQKLLQYNLEDCTALRAVTDHVAALASREESSASSSIGSFRVASVQEFDQQSRTRKWGAVQFVHPDYDVINRCAYFNYQRQRVYVRTSGTLRKNRERPRRERMARLPATRRAYVLASECEVCQSTNLEQSRPCARLKSPRGKRAFDVIGTRGGLRLSVIDCRSKIFRCRDCGAEFVPTAYRRLARYFHGLMGWAMYQHIVHQLSFGTIKDMINTFFNFPIPKRDVHCFKSDLARFYEPSIRYVWEQLLAGPLLHVDETQLRLKGGKTAYVWAFTNLDAVAYLCRPNREGEFLRDLLKDFRGVLVTDFYTAYDSIDCPQQKCLAHLIRDMNDEVRANPFDEELQSITKPFGAVLRPIVETIGEHGLRKWHLRRHKRAVAEFFQSIEATSLRSEVAQSMRDRLLKYRHKLFTFFDYDGVPWNNNNAEHAIKRFALYRAHASGMMRESGVAEFLTLLSVCQTCKYRNLSFWRFLLSRQQISDTYKETKTSRAQLPLEVHPEGFVTGWQRLTEAAHARALVHEPDQLSALEAAIKVLEKSKSPLTANQLIEAMATKGYWSSTARAPARSLSCAIQREIRRMGTDCLFKRVGRSKYALVKPRQQHD